jgi:PAS domain S-box-containing protein
MKDKYKKKEQLINELIDLRRRIAELEKSEAELKRTEEKLQRAKEEKTNILETMSELVIYVDTKMKILWANRAAAESVGLTADELVGSYCYKEWFQNSEPCPGCPAIKVLKTGQPQEGETISPDGRAWYFRGYPFQDANGEIVGIIEVVLEITERKRMEEELRNQRNLFETILAAAPDLLILKDRNSVYQSVNPSFCQFLGRNAEEIIGKTDFDLFPYNEAEIYRRDDAKVMESGRPQIQDEEATGAEGKKWLQVVKTPVYDARGTVVGSLCSVRDITERKHMEEALKESEEQYRTLAEAAQDLIFIINRDDRVQYVNNFAAQLVRSRPEEIIGKPREELFSPNVSTQQRRNLQKVFETGKPIYVEDKFPFPNHTVWLGTNLVPLGDSAGKVRAVLGISRDITERKRAEEERQKLVSLIENNSDFIGMSSMEGQVFYLNNAGQQLVGLDSIDEVRKTYIQDYIMDEDHQKFQDEILSTVLQNGSWKDEFKLRHFKTEMPISVEMNIFLIKESETGQPIAFAMLNRDITERKKMEGELIKAQKIESLGILAGGIAHDFNNILTGILGNITLAKAYVKPEDSVADRLTEAEKACLQAKDLTQQLLTFSRGGAPVKKTFSITELLKDSATFVLRGSSVQCEFSIPDDLWLVEVDEGQINQVISNLIINSAQAMPEGGTIKVQAENTVVWTKDIPPLKNGRYLKISIEDKGIGIQEEHLRRIFDPYFTTKQRGSGLGLAVAYSIIKKHEGYIDVKSQLGVGTTFFIYLPASEHNIINEKKIDKIFKGVGRILLMDDEDVVRHVVGEMLKHLGYNVEFAKDGAEAIKLYEIAKETGKPFDAVIMDLTVPGGIGGKEAINKLLEIDPNVKAIVSSGYSNDPVLSNYTEYGFCGGVAKPYKLEELGKTLHEIILGGGE